MTQVRKLNVVTILVFVAYKVYQSVQATVSYPERTSVDGSVPKFDFVVTNSVH